MYYACVTSLDQWTFVPVIVFKTEHVGLVLVVVSSITGRQVHG